ncbi:hypothetical protein HWV62_38272 [Athelia sp. TMB]|nr:hypothetical protein HWV62_38272 [Athelia sp. TMB]
MNEAVFSQLAPRTTVIQVDIIPVQGITDLASSNSGPEHSALVPRRSFIRSKVAPHDYWLFPRPSAASGPGRGSSPRASRHIADAQMAPGTIMISTDEIVIVRTQVGVRDRVAVAERGSDSVRPMLRLSGVRAVFASEARRLVVDDENDSDIVVKELIEAKGGNVEGRELTYGTSTIAFPNSDVADEWWRALSTHPELGRCMQRCTPQLYIWDVTIAQSYQLQGEVNTIPNSKYRDVVARFIPRMVLSSHYNNRVSEPFGIIPVREVTDLVSGSSFFIRSKVEPHEYWYCPRTPVGSQIYTSRKERTPFRVRIVDGRMKDGTIMIGTDPIVITSVDAPNRPVGIKERWLKLTAAGEQTAMKLSDLRNRFGSSDRTSIEGKNVAGKPLFERHGNGQYWELVSS